MEHGMNQMNLEIIIWLEKKLPYFKKKYLLQRVYWLPSEFHPFKTSVD